MNVVSACSLVVLQGMRRPEQGADFERSFRMLRSLPADIWVTSHARLWGRYRKFVARATAKNPADPFIDPEGVWVMKRSTQDSSRSDSLNNPRTA